MTPNGTTAPDTEGAFIEWVKHASLESWSVYANPSLQINTFSIKHPIQSLQDLNDGQVLWQILRKDNTSLHRSV